MAARVPSLVFLKVLFYFLELLIGEPRVSIPVGQTPSCLHLSYFYLFCSSLEFCSSVFQNLHFYYVYLYVYVHAYVYVFTYTDHLVLSSAYMFRADCLGFGNLSGGSFLEKTNSLSLTYPSLSVWFLVMG